MVKRRLLLSLAGSVTVCLALAEAGEATVPRAFVSINGSDANPCSAVQPCRSFNAALLVVETGGEIVVEDSGGYSTGFTITQSVTIDAAGFNASVISLGSGDLCAITAGASDRVVLRGISFHGANVGGNAINVTKVGSLYVEHCSIAEFSFNGVTMPNGGNLWVTDTDVRKCSGFGLDVETTGATAANLVAQDSRFAECTRTGLGAAIFVRTGGTGIATGWVTNCTASLCDSAFEVVTVSPLNAELTLTNCRAFGNTVALDAETVSAGSATMRIVNCVVTKNSTGIQVDSGGGGGIASVVGTSPGSNDIHGNTIDGSTSATETLH